SADPVGTWLTRRLGQDKADTPDKLWRKILLFPPDLKEVKPEELPETAIFEGWGWVSMRSGWDADAVFAHFSSGMKGQGEPAHLDNNQFVIYHKGLLAVDGVKPVASEKFPDTYERMTLAHNTITVYDPEEKIWGRSMYVYTQVHNNPFPVNDGGQTFRKDCYLDNLYNVRGPSKMVKQGDIVAYETSALYDYTCGDATKSYAAHKMKHFTRQFVFLKPDLFVVFDRVVSTKKEYRKRWHLQFFAEPVVEGTLTRVDYDGGRLWCETLLPEKATVRKVQGSQVEQADGTYVLPEIWRERDSDSWRIDVGPGEARTDDVFLHVLQATDAGKPRTFTAETFRKGGSVGVRVKRGSRTFEVLFATAGAPGGHLTIVEDGKPLTDKDLATQVVDSYAQWKDDPRFRMWMTDKRFRYTIPEADRERFAVK
ncbi:MAG TPA: heparinase II/III family protein, partial [Planctomycetota bacterium]|nr:heparinase II/III family protein [Planctomycetota bacterium]